MKHCKNKLFGLCLVLLFSSSVMADNIEVNDTSVTPTQNVNTTITSNAQPLSNPSFSNTELNEANQQLLTKNTELQRQVNDLQTQVNVLVHEQSGQMFLYGVITVIFGLALGMFISWLVFRKRDEW